MLSTSRLILGTAKFGMEYGTLNQSQVPAESVKSILDRATEHGINRIDTANSYGTAERIIGKSISSSSLVISKIAGDKYQNFDPANRVRMSVLDSLMKLNIERLHAILFHDSRYLFDKDGETMYRAALSLREEGLVDNIGCSVYSPSELEAVNTKFDFEVFQLPLNIFDRRFVESGSIESLARSGKEVHIRSVFMKGLLLRKSGQFPSWMSMYQDNFEEWLCYLVEHQLNPVQACLDFVFGVEGVSGVIIGVSSLKQLDEIVEIGLNKIKSPSFSPNCINPIFFDPRKWA